MWDRLWRFGAEVPQETWGGIAYSLAGMAAALPPGWEMVPLVKIGADRQREARALLGEFPCVAFGAEMVVPEPTNRVELHYTDHSHRGERPSGGVPPWRWDELAPRLTGIDALYVNFISGEEMDLATLEQLRAGFSGTIYGDIHTLLLGHRPGGERFARPLPDWDRWLSCFDGVQINEVELETQAAYAGAEPWVFAREMLREPPGLVAVTLGERGAWVAVAGEEPRQIGVPTSIAGDPTGCGDVWGSTFFASLFGGARIGEAVLRAHRAAAVKMVHPGASGLYRHLVRGSLPA